VEIRQKFAEQILDDLSQGKLSIIFDPLYTGDWLFDGETEVLAALILLDVARPNEVTRFNICVEGTFVSYFDIFLKLIHSRLAEPDGPHIVCDIDGAFRLIYRCR
jgi:hypothetical protein